MKSEARQAVGFSGENQPRSNKRKFFRRETMFKAICEWYLDYGYVLTIFIGFWIGVRSKPKEMLVAMVVFAAWGAGRWH